MMKRSVTVEKEGDVVNETGCEWDAEKTVRNRHVGDRTGKVVTRYMVPARRRSANPKDEEQRKGLCHLCKGQGHIQRHCPKKTPDQPTRAANMKITPLVADQGIK